MLPATINIFEKAARKAGKILVRDFGEIENLQIQSKSIGDFVTSADLKIEKSLLETLQYYFPNANYLTEETGMIKGEGDALPSATARFLSQPMYVALLIAEPSVFLLNSSSLHRNKSQR